MKEIYLMPKKLQSLDKKIKNIKLGEIYNIYPKEKSKEFEDIIVKNYESEKSQYDVIHLGEVIECIKKIDKEINIRFLKYDDVIIYFDNHKKDNTLYIRIILVTIVILIGSTMAIMNFHADVNMKDAQQKLVQTITGNATYWNYFQIPYSIGIAIGVGLFFNKIIPNYAKHEPSPLDLKMSSLNSEIEKQLKNNLK